MTATPTLLKQVFPAFAEAPDATVQYWLDQALKTTGDWDSDHATMLLAAHYMAVNGIGEGNEHTKMSGVSSLKSGALSLSFKESSSTGDWGRSSYGQQFAAMLADRAGAGPLVTGTGAIVGYHGGRWPHGAA